MTPNASASARNLVPDDALNAGPEHISGQNSAREHSTMLNTEVPVSLKDGSDTSQRNQIQMIGSNPEHTLGLPPRPGSSRVPPQAPVIMSSRAGLAAANGPNQGSGNLFDFNRQKREEISQFLE